MRTEPCTPVYVTVSATSVVSDRNCIVQSITLTPAAAAAEVQLFDEAATSVAASIKISVKAVANGASVVVPISGSGLSFNKGCVAVVTGTGATATIGVAKI